MDKVKIVNRAQHETIMKLINAVKQYPILYNSKRTDYRDVELKRDYWLQVQAETHISTVEECQKLWKTLRDRFIRETRALENNGKLAGSITSQNAAAATVRWPYYEALLFYRNCGRSPRTYLSSSSTSNAPASSRRASAPATATLNSSGEDNNTSSSLNSTHEEHQFPTHQAFIEAVFRQAQTRLATSSPSSSQESIPLALDRSPSSPNQSHQHCPQSSQVAVAVVRPISPGALVNATSSMALVSRESSVQSVNEECTRPQVNNNAKRPDKLSIPTERGEKEMIPDYRERTPENQRERSHSFHKSNKCNDTENDGQALNLSTHNLSRSAREAVGEEPEPKKQKTSDEDELFALSLVPTLKRLGAKVKSLTKIKILQQLAMAEFGVDKKFPKIRD